MSEEDRTDAVLIGGGQPIKGGFLEAAALKPSSFHRSVRVGRRSSWLREMPGQAENTGP